MTTYENISLWIDGVEAFAAVAVPVVLAAAGFVVSRRLRAIEIRNQVEQQAREKRLVRYEDLTRLANDFYCFSVLVGRYLELTPECMLARKREFESIMYATLPMWDQRFLAAANQLLAACFITMRGRGKRPILTADFARHLEERGKEACEGWNDYFLDPEDRKQWIDGHFAPAEHKRSYREEIVMPAYAQFLASVSRVIGHDRDAEDLLAMLRGADRRREWSHDSPGGAADQSRMQQGGH